MICKCLCECCYLLKSISIFSILVEKSNSILLFLGKKKGFPFFCFCVVLWFFSVVSVVLWFFSVVLWLFFCCFSLVSVVLSCFESQSVHSVSPFHSVVLENIYFKNVGSNCSSGNCSSKFNS